MITSKAIISDGKGKFWLDDVQVFPPQADEVRVKILAAGLCHTDWDSIQNWDKTFIVGHEGAGVVESVGPLVTSVKAGDKVILNWCIPCGKCFQCLEGNLHICEQHSPVCGNKLAGHAALESTLYKQRGIERSFHLGTMSEYTLVKEAAVVKTSSPIDAKSAAIIGCGVMTGYGSVVNAAKVAPGTSVCVIGCGGVGLNVIQAAKISGAVKIIAIDIHQSRLDQAKKFGATHGILSLQNDPDFKKTAEKVQALTQGRGADYAFECTAIPALGSAPLALIRNAGTAVQVSGIEESIQFNCELFEWDKTYINPLYGMCNPNTDFTKLIGLYDNGQLLLDELITKTYKLKNLAEGFEDMLGGNLAKGVVMINQ